MADHLEGITHDNVQYFFDNTVLNKAHSHKIELVRRQYSGNAYGVIKGIGVVNCVYIAQIETSAAEDKSGIRWRIEQFHRADRQIKDLECCPCRVGPILRNHIGLANLTWLRFKQLAYQTRQTVYQLKRGLLDNYLCQALVNPSLVFA